jgi:hypothetical protein
MFASKVRAYPNGAYEMLLLWKAPSFSQKTLDQAEKVFQGQTLYLILPLSGTKKYLVMKKLVVKNKSNLIQKFF